MGKNKDKLKLNLGQMCVSCAEIYIIKSLGFVQKKAVGGGNKDY